MILKQKHKTFSIWFVLFNIYPTRNVSYKKISILIGHIKEFLGLINLLFMKIKKYIFIYFSLFVKMILLYLFY